MANIGSVFCTFFSILFLSKSCSSDTAVNKFLLSLFASWELQAAMEENVIGKHKALLQDRRVTILCTSSAENTAVMYTTTTGCLFSEAVAILNVFAL